MFCDQPQTELLHSFSVSVSLFSACLGLVTLSAMQEAFTVGESGHMRLWELVKKSREGCASGWAGLAVVENSRCEWGQGEAGNHGHRVALSLSPPTSVTW